MIRVYFNPDYTQGSQTIKIENLLHVADVDVPDLRTALELCQNSDTPWTDQPEVTPLAAVAEGTRSVAPGDVLEMEGEWYLVAANDFQKI